MIEKRLLVIAFKFNDILYASSTEEYANATERHLVVFVEKFDLQKFPLLDQFDKVTAKKITKSRLVQLYSAVSLLLGGALKGGYHSVVLSNPFLLMTKLIVSKVVSERVVLVEDGAMNYYSFKGNLSVFKKIIEKVLFFDRVMSRICSTYLIEPDKAVCFFGEKNKIDLKVLNKLSPPGWIVERLKNKKIFLGGGVLEYLSAEDKNFVLKKILDDFGFDVFIPHHASSDILLGVENIRLSDLGVTIECLIPLIGEATIYTFGSSTLLNSKVLNPGLKTVFLKFYDSNLVGDVLDFYRLMESACDEVLYISNP